ncbi:MAG TPA: hypothetical protein ENN40_11990 [Candidatus Aminicenantes bacterium]|nr:hypothetical protein [Candidatus Aminicenantes bacterium]
MKRLMIVLAAVCLMTAGPGLWADGADKGPEITGGVTFYWYTFMWGNTDFNNSDYTAGGVTVDGSGDSYNYNYGHGSMWMKADWEGASVYAKLGAWGPYGMQPIYTAPLDPSARLLEGYLDIKKLIGPFSLRVGKFRFAYGEGLVAFDGGEDGTTGYQLFAAEKNWSLDLFYRKGQDNAGWNEMAFNPTPGSRNPEATDDWNVWGAYATLKLDKFTVSPYLFYKKFGEDTPMWIGADVSASLVKGLALKLEYVQMFGSNAWDQDYNGFGMILKADYTTDSGLNVGAGYVIASGDDNYADNKNGTYEAVLHNPYTGGFYKGWVGLGPAHMCATIAGFSLLAPFEYLMTNVTSLNAHVGYKIKNVSLRLDFYKYGKHKLAVGDKDMGYEIAVMAMTNIKGIDVGGTFGVWKPGDHFSKTLNKGDDSSYGGYIFFSKGFDFKLR